MSAQSVNRQKRQLSDYTLQNYNYFLIYTRFLRFFLQECENFSTFAPNYVICPKGQKMKKH